LGIINQKWERSQATAKCGFLVTKGVILFVRSFGDGSAGVLFKPEIVRSKSKMTNEFWSAGLLELGERLLPI
jgi:hypothetical protein